MKQFLLIGLSIIWTLTISAHKKIIVTGGAGFIGSHVAEKLLERGDTVIIIDNLNDYYDIRIKQHNLACVFDPFDCGPLGLRFQPSPKASADTAGRTVSKNNVVFYHADICDTQRMQEIFEYERPDLLCHLAARAGVRPSVEYPDLYVQSNVLGTVVMLEMARKYAIKNVVVASSSSVYGAQSKIPFIEDDVCDKPCSQYAATKRACELLCYTYHHLYGLSISCLRFFTVYGPRGRVDMAPFKFIDSVYNNKIIEQYGDGSALRDFTYIDDIVDGVIKALDIPCGFEIFNLGRGEPIKLCDFITTIEEIVGKKVHIKIVDSVPGDVPCTFADIKKAQKILGYRPQTSIKHGLEKLFAWYKNDFCNYFLAK